MFSHTNAEGTKVDLCAYKRSKVIIISSQTLKRGGCRGTTDDVATIPFHPSPSSTILRESPNSIPWSHLPISSSVFLSFLHLSLSPTEDLEMWLYRVSVSSPWLGGHHALQLQSGFCCKPPRSSHGLCRKCSEFYSISSRGLESFSWVLPSRSSSHRHKERWP